jgi:hypothetical protein
VVKRFNQQLFNIQASMRRQRPCCRATALTRGFNTKLYTV